MAEIPKAGMRLALYARVSTEEQREGQTIDSQVAELERFARENAWQITGIYKDEGWSGAVMARPELDRLRDDAQKAVFEAVLINDVDRLARDVAHLGVIKQDLERKGVKVIFRKLPSDASPMHNLMVNILGSFAEFEREMIADRTRRGRRHKVETRKQYLGSNTSYGYRYLPKDRAAGKEGVLEVNPAEATVVREMYEWVDEDGLSARRVVNRLNARRIPPKKGAARWAKSSVLRILRNEMYAGVWYYNKYQGCEPKNPRTVTRYRKSRSSNRLRLRSEWIALVLPEALRVVPRERWQRVQQQLDRNLAFSPRNEKHAYLLKGLVQCGGCGARYVGDPCHRKFYYRCIARCKRLPTVREAVLDEIVKGAIKKMILNPSVLLEPLQRLDDAEGREGKQREDAAQSVEQELKRLEIEEGRILDAYRATIISPAQLGQQLEKLKAQRAAIELRRIQAQREDSMPRAEIEKAVTDYCAEAANNLAAFTHERWREFLRTIVHAVLFHGTHIRIKGRIPINPAPASDAADPSLGEPSDLSGGRIATTKVGLHGHNPAQGKLGTGFNLSIEVPRPIWEPPPRDELGRFC
jgi:site-specific DNA recombinase